MSSALLSGSAAGCAWASQQQARAMPVVAGQQSPPRPAQPGFALHSLRAKVFDARLAFDGAKNLPRAAC
eukprot:CAMPEP_0115657842 /NCGR_PEP_ID=MMETSP0272-20121206/44895_1 /TAXON_ID=71861 /ORGANISM="Scrippsiella trochoidea, Strain CCMP3099" /LENGTH=68 /DNA_ID=CAMNT_0003095895 /DNA_START=18 /DNA_END=221 /DNA_ORIENTATION=+